MQPRYFGEALTLRVSQGDWFEFSCCWIFTWLLNINKSPYLSSSLNVKKGFYIASATFLSYLEWYASTFIVYSTGLCVSGPLLICVMESIESTVITWFDNCLVSQDKGVLGLTKGWRYLERRQEIKLKYE